MFNITDNKIPYERLDNDGSVTENFSREPWYIIAYVLDFRQSQLYDVLTKKALLGDLANALVGYHVDGEIPHCVVVKEQNKAKPETKYWQQEKL